MPSSATSPARRCACSTTCASHTGDSTTRYRSTSRRDIRVELNHTDPTCCPRAYRLATTTRGCSRSLEPGGEGRDVTVISKDLPLRVEATTIGLRAEEYRRRAQVVSGWTGMDGLDLSEHAGIPTVGARVATLDDVIPAPALGTAGDRHRATCRATRAWCCTAGVPALGRVTADKRCALVRGDREAFGVHGRSAEQRVALDLLLDPEVGIVSLGGRAGTGKSALALCAGLEAVLERRQHRKVMVFRPLYAVGGQELGYLPGTEAEKMSPWGQAVFDTLGASVSPHVIDEVLDRDLLEVLPLTHIRGRSLHDAFVIVDEAQSLERGVLLTVLSRVGQNSRVVLTHDVAQRDNLRVGRHDGVAAVIEALKGHPLFAHVTLTRSERSPIAALVTEMLEGIEV